MNTKKVIRVMAAIALMLTVSIQAEAQLGGLKQLKEKAGQAVKETTEKAKQTASDKVEQTATGTASETRPEKKAPLVPSAAAIAADPKASDKTVANGFSRSNAEIRAAYEQLPGDIYFKPYYHPQLKNYYFLDASQYPFFFAGNYAINETHRMQITSATDVLKYDETTNMFKTRYSSLPVQYLQFITDTIPEGNKHVGCAVECTGYAPVGTHSIFAYFALFAADPQGFIPFEKYCEANLAAAIYQRGRDGLFPGEKQPWNGKTVPLGDGKYGELTFNWGILSDLVRKEGNRLHEIALTETPIIVIQSAAAGFYNKTQQNLKDKNYGVLRFNFHLFETAMYYWKYSKNKTAKDEQFDFLVNEYEKQVQMYPKWIEGEMLDAKPIAMPKTHDMGADLAQKALDAAKSQFAGSFNVDEVVFTTNQWHEFKEPKYPYRVMHRSLEAALLTKEGDKWMIRFYDFLQMSDTSGGWTQSYGFQAGADASPKVVNYKP